MAEKNIADTNRRVFLASLSGAAAVPAAAVTTKPDWHSIPVADPPYETQNDQEGIWMVLRHGDVAIRALLCSHPSDEPTHKG